MEQKLRVLIVDDDEQIRRDFRAYLEGCGCMVSEALNGNQGFDSHAREAPDIIFTDLHMAQTGGLRLVETMQKSDPNTPVIVISGSGDVQDAIEAIRLGAWDYIVKPLSDMKELDRSIQRALRRARLLKESRRYQENLEKLVAQKNWQLEGLASELSLAENRERKRLSFLIHDEVTQSLAASNVRMNILRTLISSPQELELLDQCQMLTSQATESARSLTSQLSPPVLDELGLGAALQSLARQFEKQHGIVCSLRWDGGNGNLSENIRHLLFSCVRELLTNIIKHSGAGHVRIEVQSTETSISIIVEDDGCGFDETMSQHPHADGFGLFSIRERLGYLNGQCIVDSKPGQGTRVTLIAPVC